MSNPSPIVFGAAETAEDWRAVEAIRTTVFVDEQNCPVDEEFDDLEEVSQHVLGRADDGSPVAAARWRVVTKAGQPYAKLERFAILPEHRGGGSGRRLVGYVLDLARRAGHRHFLVHAQAHLQRFYESYGFVAQGEPFDEAGIPHVRMTLVEPVDIAEPT